VGRRLSERFVVAGLTAALAVACGASSQKDAPRGSDAAGSGGLATGGSGGVTGGTGGGGRGGSGGSGGTIVETTGGTDGGVECQRDVTLTAVTLGDPPPFDLVIVADHSDSLAWSRDELSAGLSSLLTNVRGRSVRIFVLTPTQYGASSAVAELPLTGDPVVDWRDATTGQAFPNAMTTYEQTCTDPLDQPMDCPGGRDKIPYKSYGTWRFAMPEPLAVLTPELTEAELEAAEQTVANAILSIGGGGSPEEQPLCTLGRYLTQDRAALPSHAVFLVISDEDDVSVPEDDCLLGFDGELRRVQSESGTTPCSSDCDAWRYSMSGVIHWQRLAFRCSAVDDLGMPIAGTDMMSWLNESVQPTCNAFAAGACTPEEEARASIYCDSGLSLVGCARECATRDSSCYVDLPDDSVDACNQAFTHGGQTHENLADYCGAQGDEWGPCAGGGILKQTTESWVGYADRKPLVKSLNAADLARFVKTTAAGTFGADRHLIEGIVLDPEFSCELGAGQSYATNLSLLVTDRSKLFPLCEPYAPALDGVLAFAQNLIQTEFTVTLKDDEDVTAVFIVQSDGSERALATGDFSYDRATATLRVERDVLRLTDVSLRVEVTSDCRPVVK
jgi:hypothetical protein